MRFLEGERVEERLRAASDWLWARSGRGGLAADAFRPHELLLEALDVRLCTDGDGHPEDVGLRKVHRAELENQMRHIAVLRAAIDVLRRSDEVGKPVTIRCCDPTRSRDASVDAVLSCGGEPWCLEACEGVDVTNPRTLRRSLERLAPHRGCGRLALAALVRAVSGTWPGTSVRGSQGATAPGVRLTLRGFEGTVLHLVGVSDAPEGRVGVWRVTLPSDDAT